MTRTTGFIGPVGVRAFTIGICILGTEIAITGVLTYIIATVGTVQYIRRLDIIILFKYIIARSLLFVHIQQISLKCSDISKLIIYVRFISCTIYVIITIASVNLMYHVQDNYHHEQVILWYIFIIFLPGVIILIVYNDFILCLILINHHSYHRSNEFHHSYHRSNETHWPLISWIIILIIDPMILIGYKCPYYI
jgi:hypothetical protein